MIETMEVDEAQPVRSLERTMDIIPEILCNPKFSAEVARYHGWEEDSEPIRVALMFLTGRFQWAVDLLTLRTETLKRVTDGNTTRIVALEDEDIEEDTNIE